MKLQCVPLIQKIRVKIKATGFFLILAALLFSSCGDPTAPEDLLEDDRYIAVFSQLLVINQLTEDQLDGVSRDYLKEQVYIEYDVTNEQFQRTHRYYQLQPEQHIQRLDKIEEMLTNQRDQFQDRLNKDRKMIADSLSALDSLSESSSSTEPADTTTIETTEIDNNNN